MIKSVVSASTYCSRNVVKFVFTFKRNIIFLFFGSLLALLIYIVVFQNSEHSEYTRNNISKFENYATDTLVNRKSRGEAEQPTQANEKSLFRVVYG